ncbi:MAG: hypothetical protein SVQ76_02625 [Candidatus Nanohaloarchaea archaeon]|nr:hypothetical protein [Candidatus Nanohaloarchaea archaeon]
MSLRDPAWSYARQLRDEGVDAAHVSVNSRIRDSGEGPSQTYEIAVEPLQTGERGFRYNEDIESRSIKSGSLLQITVDRADSIRDILQKEDIRVLEDRYIR